MNRTLLLILTSTLVAGSIFAGSRPQDALTSEVEGNDNFEDVSYNLPSNLRLNGELSIYQAIAAAITQTAVLSETRQERLAAAENSRKKVTIRGRDLTLGYSRNYYSQECYLAVGPRQKWRTVNGQWAAREVNSRALKRALDVLSANGLSVRDISVSVSDARDLRLAQEILHRIGLGKISVVGNDPDQPTHASITFNTI